LESTLAFVDDRLGRVRGVLRLAIFGIEGLLSSIFAVPGETRRTVALARRLDSTSLPVFGDYARLVRSLAIVSVYEARLPDEVRDDRAR
jgi:hypothetical protein